MAIERLSTQFTREVAAEVRGLMAARKISQTVLAERLDRRVPVPCGGQPVERLGNQSTSDQKKQGVH